MYPASTDGGQQKRFFVIIMTSICAVNVYHFWHDRKKCCVLSRLFGAPTAPRREIGAPADLTVVRKATERSVRFLIIRLFPERGETSSLSRRYLFCSPLLITFPLLILVVLLRLVRLRSRPIPFSLPPFLSPLLRSRSGSATVTVAPDSPLFRRRRIFPRNRSAVHQFRRDVVARSLEENYRVQG